MNTPTDPNSDNPLLNPGIYQPNIESVDMPLLEQLWLSDPNDETLQYIYKDFSSYVLKEFGRSVSTLIR